MKKTLRFVLTATVWISVGFVTVGAANYLWTLFSGQPAKGTFAAEAVESTESFVRDGMAKTRRLIGESKGDRKSEHSDTNRSGTAGSDGATADNVPPAEEQVHREEAPKKSAGKPNSGPEERREDNPHLQVGEFLDHDVIERLSAIADSVATGPREATVSDGAVELDRGKLQAEAQRATDKNIGVINALMD